MRPQDIVIGEVYRHKDHIESDHIYARVLEKVMPKVYPNVHTYIIFKCHWYMGSIKNHDNDDFMIIKYFRATDLREVNR